MLANVGTHTISGAICTIGNDQNDWSSVYRLFEKERVNINLLFEVIQNEVKRQYHKDEPILAFIDDTLLKKTGKKVHGTSWKLDPLGPKFTNNFVWAQRYMQISFAYPEKNNHCRGIPVSFIHCPVPKKPRKRATVEQIAEYKKLQKENCLPKKASNTIQEMENKITEKIIWIGDGGYTNQTVCRSIQHTYIGRLRKDAKLFLPPTEQNMSKGRKKYYGEKMDTPEVIRTSNLEWKEVKASTGNGEHLFKIKSLLNLRSKLTGEKNVKLLIVQPLRYRLTSKSKLLYRNPAYIICTDPNLSDEKILQYYLWRWEIELNFKDEKSLLGIDESHIWSKSSVETYPAFVSAIYGLFLLACKEYFGDEDKLIYPKWRSPKTVWRTSSNKYLSLFRNELMSSNINKSGFESPVEESLKPLLLQSLYKTIFTSANY